MSAYSHGGLYKKFSILDRRPRPEPEAGRENAEVLFEREQALLRAKERRHQSYDLAMQDSLYATDEERIARQQQTFREYQEQLFLKQQIRQEIDPRGPPIGFCPESAALSRPPPTGEDRQALSPEGPACSGLSNIGADSEDYNAVRRRLEAARIKEENLQVAAEAARRRRMQAEQDKEEFRATFVASQRGRSPGVLG